MSIRDKRITYHRAVAAHMAVSHKVMIFRPRRVCRKLRRVNGLKHPQRAVGIAPHNILGIAYLPVMPRTRLRARRNGKCKNDRQQIYQIPHRFSFYLFSHRADSRHGFPLCHQVVHKGYRKDTTIFRDLRSIPVISPPSLQRIPNPTARRLSFDSDYLISQQMDCR